MILTCGAKALHSVDSKEWDASMEVSSLLGTLRRRWWIIVLITLIGAAAGAAPKPKTTIDPTSVSYSASHTLLVSSTSATDTIFSDPVALSQLQLFATTGEVPKRVAAKIGYAGNAASLAAQVTVEVDTSTGAIRITTTQSDPDLAVKIADAFGDELTGYLAERQDDLQQRRVASTLERLTTLENDIKTLEKTVAANPDDDVSAAQLDALTRQYSATFESYNQLTVDQGQLQLTTLERAQPIKLTTGGGLSAPKSRSSRGILLGGVGLVVGFGVIALLARLDRRIRTKQQAEKVFGLRSQVGIPLAPKGSEGRLVVTADRHDSLSDAYRSLRSVVGFVEAGLDRDHAKAPTIVVVSAGPGDGKTSVSANLAAAFVETGHHTIAVNTDFRRPSLSERLLGKKPAPLGVAFEELPSARAEELLRHGPFEEMELFDLSSVKASPGDLARETARILPELRAIGSTVVIDTSPVGATAEVLELVPLADIIVLVARLDHTTVDSATRTIEIIRAVSKTEILLTLVGEAVERTNYYNEYSQRPGAPAERRFLRKR